VDSHLFDDGVAWLGGIPEDVDWRKPSPARVYDVHLGGAHNFAVDREVAERVAALMPELPTLLRANRSFLRRAVRYLVESGVRQFLDLGSGIPTVGNVHEVALSIDPSCRIVYVDQDPIAVSHSRALLSATPNTGAVLGDLRDPAAILADHTVRGLLDFDQPIAVLLVAVLHFVPDSDDPAGILRQYVDALAPGSHVVLSHATGNETEHVRSAADEYSRSVDGFFLRTNADVAAMLTGLTLVEPGLTGVSEWRPDDEQEHVATRMQGCAAVARI
jgi:SAM-dependent methyltransferase